MGPQAGRRPLSQLLGERSRFQALPLPAAGSGTSPTARDAAAEFKKFWNTKVWPTRDSDASGGSRPQTHRLLYTLRVIHTLMLSDVARPAEPRVGEKLFAHIHTEGHTVGEPWSRGFLYAGGLELFLDVFEELLSCSDCHTLSCISLLAECIRELLAQWQYSAVDVARVVGAGGQRDDLDAALHTRLPSVVSQLMDALFRVVRGEFRQLPEANTVAGAAPQFAAYSTHVLTLCTGQGILDEASQPTGKAGGAPKVQSQVSSDASNCVARIFSLLHLIVRREPSCVGALCGFEHTGPLLLDGLLVSDLAVREAMAAGVYTLCAQDPSDQGSLSSTLLTQLLFVVLPEWQRHPTRSDQLFGVIARLLQRHRSPQPVAMGPAAMGLVPQPQPLAPCLDELGQHEASGGSSSMAELLDSLVSQLRADAGGIGSTTEERGMDGMMLGMLQLIHSILHCFPHLKGPASHNLVAELLSCCLGPVSIGSESPVQSKVKDTTENAGEGGGSSVAPRCHTRESRQAVFALLHELATDSPEACRWVAQLLLASGARAVLRTGARWRSSDWIIQPDTGVKSATGFVGLKNLGATCYMNSVLQQLFAHTEFQRGILQSEAPPEGSKGSKRGASIQTADNAQSASSELLYQVQVLFSSLQSSERQFYIPKGFCAAFRDWEGRPVNVLQQMDADEFLSLLMDQLERATGHAPRNKAAIADEDSPQDGPNTNQRSFLRNIFGGTLCTEIIPKASGAARSERHEDFLVLSLQVKGKPSVRASLAAFVDGEMLEGDNAYYSEEAGCKVDALKRTCIDRLPKTLIFVLKRFEFDLDTMQKVKVNDLCEFPMRLDMWPYTKEALDGGSLSEGDANKYEYVLCGVVLHSGTADSGHYSSLVKVADDAGQTQWYEFNDTVVSPVDEEEIPHEAFGGLRDDDVAPGLGGLNGASVAPLRSKNAYLLFYEKATVARGETQEPLAATDADKVIRRSVEASNRSYWHSQVMFSAEYFDFAWLFAANVYSSPVLLAGETVTAPEAERVGALKYMQLEQLRRDSPSHGSADVQEDALPLLASQFVAGFLFTILARSRDRQSLPEWCSLTCRMLQRTGPSSQRWFAGVLASHGFLREVFLECPLQETRTALLAVAVRVLRWIYDQEATQLQLFTATAPLGEPRHGQIWCERPCVPGFGLPGPDAGNHAPLLAQIWATLIELLPVALQPEAHYQFTQFFELLHEFLILGPATLAWACKAGGINELFEFALQGSKAPALDAAMERAQKWYQPNWLRIAAPTSKTLVTLAEVSLAGSGQCNRDCGDGNVDAALPLRPVSPGIVLDMDCENGQGSSQGYDSVCLGDYSFERHIHSDVASDTIELGPLWGAIATLLECDSQRVDVQDEENDALMRRLVRLGGASAKSCGSAGRLLRLFCRGNMGRSQGVVCRICERTDESDGRALRGALRMGSTLVNLSDTFTQPRSVFLLKSVLHVAKHNRKYFRTMHLMIHYIVKWCRRRPELPQWLLSDAASMALGTGQYRWLETWVRENTGGGGDSWSGWQAGAYSGSLSSSVFRRSDTGVGDGGDSGTGIPGPTRWSWCSEILPYVRKITRGEPITKEPIISSGDSDFEPLEAQPPPPGKRPMLVPPVRSSISGYQMRAPILSKVQMVSVLAAAQRSNMAMASTGTGGAVTAW